MAIGFSVFLLYGCAHDGTSPDSEEHRNARLIALDKDKRDLLAALAREQDQVARLKQELARLEPQNQKLAELEQRVREQEAELLDLREKARAQGKLEEARTRIRLLSAKLSDCADETRQLKDDLAAKPPPPPPPPPVPPVGKIDQTLLTVLQPEVKNGDVTIKQGPNALLVTVASSALFQTGSDIVHPQGSDILKRIGAVLKTTDKKTITVTAYTDQTKLPPALKKRFPSNKEFSLAQAESGARILKEAGVDPTMVKTAGKGEAQPVGPNTTEEGRRKNRRLEIRLASRTPTALAGAAPAKNPRP
jgi:flagellar motor protein MotB